MEDRPRADELLAAVALLLSDEVLAELDGPLQHKVRVAANLCRIIERELLLSPESSAAERRSLATLLGGDGTLPELNEQLSERLRAADEAFLAASADVLLDAVVAKLAIDKPGYVLADAR